MRSQMRKFVLERRQDVSGVSGTGDIAEGVEFHDGQVVVSWFGQFHSIEIWPNIADCDRVHGHGGKTVIRWVE